MELKWRPKDWDDSKPKVNEGARSMTTNSRYYVGGYRQGVEAGADAMLEAIEKELPDEMYILMYPEDAEEDAIALPKSTEELATTSK